MVSSPESEGEPLSFKFEVGVRPPAKLGEYKGLEVGKAETEVPDDIVDPRSSGSARASPGWSRSSARPPRATRC